MILKQFELMAIQNILDKTHILNNFEYIVKADATSEEASQGIIDSVNDIRSHIIEFTEDADIKCLIVSARWMWRLAIIPEITRKELPTFFNGPYVFGELDDIPIVITPNIDEHAGVFISGDYKNNTYTGKGFKFELKDLT